MTETLCLQSAVAFYGLKEMVDATFTQTHLLAAGVPLNSQLGVSLCSLSLGLIVEFIYLFGEESTLLTKVSPADEQVAICCSVTDERTTTA